jgi:hypothetical protein
VLNAIYEEEFLGFSYGFRPERGTHDALDALCVGITSRKVNFILDADIQSFLERASHYPRSVDCGSKRSGRVVGTWILKPFLRPQLMWTA